MSQRIDQINQVIPYEPSYRKSLVIREGIVESVDNRMRYYKSEHYVLLKEAVTLLELALWKAKQNSVKGKSKKAMVNVDAAKKECGISYLVQVL